MSHRCHAEDCKVEVPPKMLMCLRHWRMVPRALQNAIWEHYRAGQEVDKRPTKEYMIVQKCAVLYVGIKEGVYDEKIAMVDLMEILPEDLIAKLKFGAPGAKR